MNSGDLSFTIIVVAIIAAIAAVRIARIVTNNWTTEDDHDLRQSEEK